MADRPMPRLSEPMRAALEQHGRVICKSPWGQDGGTFSALGSGVRWGDGYLLHRNVAIFSAGSWPSA